MKKISHNTMSYRPIRQWWLRPLAWIGRCQSMNDTEQLIEGVQGFDLRVRFDRHGKPVFAHGLLEYEGDVMSTLTALNRIMSGTDYFSVRLLLETTPLMSAGERAYQYELFKEFCEYCELRLTNLRWWGGWARDDWRCCIYKFAGQEPSVTEMHGSVSGCKLNCLWLKSWARKHNREIIGNAQTDCVMLDYIEFK